MEKSKQLGCHESCAEMFSWAEGKCRAEREEYFAVSGCASVEPMMRRRDQKMIAQKTQRIL
jgi:hypothetical protein